MKNIAKLSLISVMLMISFSVSCTENQRARNLGGHIDIELPSNYKLVNATWKKNSLWYLTRPMRKGEEAEVYNFVESSSWGLKEGSITFKESK